MKLARQSMGRLLTGVLMITFPLSTAYAAQITGIGSKCLDVRGGSIVNNIPVQIFTCNSGANQNWTVTNGTIRAGGKCLDVTGAVSADGTPVQIFTCNGGSNQNWTIINGTIRGIGGKCLDVRGGVSTDGTAVQIFNCNSGSNQKWIIK